MKKIIRTLALLLIIQVDLILAQTIFSNGQGGGFWDDTNTWLGGVVPTIVNDVIIGGADSVYTAAGAQCNNLTVFSAGIMATGIDSVNVAGTLTVEADAFFYNQSENPTLPGSVIVLDHQSTVVHIGSGTVGGPGNLEYGNLIIQRNQGCVPGGNIVIHGDLVINNIWHNVYFRGVRPTTGSQTHTIHGNVYIYRGTWSCIDVGDNSFVGIWNVDGNVYVIDDDDDTYLQARIGPFSSSNASGLGIFNIAGDLILEGGRLQAGTSSSPGLGTGIINLGGDLSLDINSGVSTNSLGPFSLNYVGNGTQNVNMDVRFQMETIVYDTVKPNANVVFDLDTNKWGSSAAAGGGFFINFS